MPSRRGARAMETVASNTEEMTQALSMISIPPATRSQPLIYLAHIAKIFYCLLLESIKNQPDDLPCAQYDDFSEAFHQSLFDLQILTQALLDGQYVPAARVLVMTEKATTQAENDLLKFALKDIHTLYSHFEKASCFATAQWLFNEHGPYLRAENFDLTHVQNFFAFNFHLNKLV